MRAHACVSVPVRAVYELMAVMCGGAPARLAAPAGARFYCFHGVLWRCSRRDAANSTWHGHHSLALNMSGNRLRGLVFKGSASGLR